MRDHQTNFVNVRGNHYPQPAGLFGADPGNQVAERVRADFVHMRLDFL